MIRSASLLLLLCLSACESRSPIPKAAAIAGDEANAAHVTAATATAGGEARAISESTDLYEFDYSYPADAGRIAALAALLDAERDAARKQLIADAREGQASAKAGGFDYHPYASGTKWLKVAETPRFLSLSAELYSYEGGAHPNHGYDSLLWDKQAGLRLAPLDLFSTHAAFDRVVQGPFCAILDKQRAERRGAPVRRDSGDMFDECIKPSEQTVILGSSNGKTFDKVGVLVGPYAAGAYAEGDYEITLPVTAALLSTVRPGHRGAFAAR